MPWTSLAAGSSPQDHLQPALRWGCGSASPSGWLLHRRAVQEREGWRVEWGKVIFIFVISLSSVTPISSKSNAINVILITNTHANVLYYCCFHLVHHKQGAKLFYFKNVINHDRLHRHLEQWWSWGYIKVFRVSKQDCHTTYSCNIKYGHKFTPSQALLSTTYELSNKS